MKLIFFPILFFMNFALATEDEVFQRNYWGLKLNRNDPVLSTRKTYSISDVQPKIGFFHLNEQSWLVGIESGYVVFKDTDHKSESFFSLQQQSLYIYRLDYPLYLGAGTQLTYLLPTLNQTFPPDEEKKRHRQIAAGLTASLFFVGPDQSLIRLELCRWRGLRDNELHSVEYGVGIYIAIR
jgi:hypothetical protein